MSGRHRIPGIPAVRRPRCIGPASSNDLVAIDALLDLGADIANA
jgi:hypothetical protein